MQCCLPIISASTLTSQSDKYSPEQSKLHNHSELLTFILPDRESEVFIKRVARLVISVAEVYRLSLKATCAFIRKTIASFS